MCNPRSARRGLRTATALPDLTGAARSGHAEFFGGISARKTERDGRFVVSGSEVSASGVSRQLLEGLFRGWDPLLRDKAIVRQEKLKHSTRATRKNCFAA